MSLRRMAQGRPMNSVTKEVSFCGECPFSYHDDEDNEWSCTSDEVNEDGIRKIARVQPPGGNAWLPPPRWCPLRRSVHVVTLKPFEPFKPKVKVKR